MPIATQLKTMSNPESKTKCGTCHKKLNADAYDTHKKTGALYKTCRVCLVAAKSTVSPKNDRANIRDAGRIRQDILAMIHTINDPHILSACCRYVMDQTQKNQSQKNDPTGFLPSLSCGNGHTAAAMSTANDATPATPSQILNHPV